MMIFVTVKYKSQTIMLFQKTIRIFNFTNEGRGVLWERGRITDSKILYSGIKTSMPIDATIFRWNSWKKLTNLSHNPLLFEPIAAIFDATVHQILWKPNLCRYSNFLIKNKPPLGHSPNHRNQGSGQCNYASGCTILFPRTSITSGLKASSA